jgi:virginiamycin B lyase
MRMQSRMSAILLGAAAVAVMVIIIAVAISMIPNVSRNDQGSNNNNSRSGTFNQQKTENNKIANNNAASSSFNSPYVREYKLSSGTFPNGILVDRNGTVWTVGSQSHALIAFTPSEEKIKSYPLPNSSSNTPDTLTWAMAESKDDSSILFSGFRGAQLWRFEPTTHRFESIGSLTASPFQIKLDQSGNVFYTTLSAGVIGVIQKEGHTYDGVKELQLGNESFPSGLFLQNQSLWVTQSLDGKITLFHVSYQGNGRIADIVKVTEYPQKEALFSPTDIIVNNGSAWVTEHGTSFLTEYNFNTQEIKRYPTALHPIQISTLPYWLAQDPTGKGVWFNEHRGNRIAFFDFSNRTLTEYEVPTRNPQMGYIANVLTIAADPTNENRSWFTEWSEDKIGYVDKSKPIPFDIQASQKQIVIEKGQAARINIEITKKPDVELFNNTLSFNVSSSVVMSGVLLNATANFSPDHIDLSKVNGTQPVTLELKDEGIQKGQYILAISASDGAAIRTVYLQLVVK